MKDKLLMIVFIVILGSILTTALVAVESYTTPRIERNGELKRKSSILEAFDIPYEQETIEQVFLDKVRGRGSGDNKYYIAEDERIALPFLGSGLWGPIEGVLALDKNMKYIERVVIMHQEETPGLGGRIAEQDFLDRFTAKTFRPRLKPAPEGKGQADNEIDSITGATLSSEAFIGILNEHYTRFSKIVSGE
jgi:Na+-transporting NADH:ubiquinone oxidoreductase subunit C